MTRRGFAGAAIPTTVVGSMTGTVPGAAGTFSLAAATGWTFTTTPFVVVVDRGGATEEKILCSGIAGTTVTVGQRGYDGTTGQNHNAGAPIVHVLDSMTADEANSWVENAPALIWMGGL
jgi:predicted flavoprotein YhiN